MKVGDDVLHRQGFDRFFEYIGQRRAHFYWPEFLFESIGDSHQRVPLAGNRVDDTAQQATHDYLYGEFRGRQAARRRAWKAVRDSIGDGTTELYNLDTDSTESTNVADAHSDVVERLTGLMDEAHTPSNGEQ